MPTECFVVGKIQSATNDKHFDAAEKIHAGANAN